MAGGFVLVVGPSGAGKDSLITHARKALADNAGVVFPRRLVTRPSSAAEQHDSIDEETFAAASAAGKYALFWRAHGLGYAIPNSVLDDVHAGRMVVCNVSRRIIPWARLHLANVAVVEVTAPKDVLYARLAARARPEDGDIEQRLARSLETWTTVDEKITNDASVEEAGRELVNFIVRHAAAIHSACSDYRPVRLRRAAAEDGE